MMMTSTRRTVLLSGLSLAALAGTAAAARPRAAPRPRSPRIDALVARMTLEEKAGQLSTFSAARASATAVALNPAAAAANEAEQARQVRDGLIGALFNGGDVTWARQMQDVAVRESRLKIPLLFGGDVIHGFRTVFPVPLAEAASFDPDLAERTARAAAVEATTAGLAWNFAPMVDISRDARWGRGVEGAGEDVVLQSRFAAARVRGFQGRTGLADPTAMLATPKHFAAYGAAIGGLDYSAADVSERTLRETYFPSFKAAFDAGALCTMAAFNEISGIPAHANPWLLTDVLRGEWGFRGFVVSDYTGDLELIAHGLAADERDAAKQAFLAGTDMSMMSGLYLKYLPDLVRRGDVPLARVDDAVRRVLALKEQLGLFDDPYNRFAPAAVEKDDRPAHRALAREAAVKSMVLLRNEGVLPLAPSSRIALIGPFVGGPDHLNGPWVVFGNPRYAVSIEQGMRAAMGPGARLTVVAGSGLDRPLPGGIKAAVDAAKRADVAVLVVGEGENMSGESKSRIDVDIPAPQRALIAAVAATGTPMVVILKNGRALVLDEVTARADAILVAWFLGVETGPAVADILFGAAGPSGRLPISFPRSTGQSPYYYDHKTSGRPPVTRLPGEEFKNRYQETLNVAAYPFGHGLTYGRIVYERLDVGTGRLPWNGSLTVRATVRNTGTRAATELVQLYIHDRAASVTRPIRQLKDWRHVDLAPGASATVAFTLTRQDLLFVGRALDWTVEPGRFDVWIAPDAEHGLQGSFDLLA
ncbi:MAG TPA: glycoside hydrolase family 3 N-terminal domain-containing protein [Sphingomonas sp.]